MKVIKMRCHFSIIFERLWKVWAVIFIILFQQLAEIIEGISRVGLLGLQELVETGGFWAFVGIAVVSIVVLLIQFIIWRKTWIILDENLITLEKYTLNRRNNTIAIENISSVNVERNLFERIVGTSRLKFDTNSAAKASETDISIVLREDIAIAFRKEIIDRMNAVNEDEMEEYLSYNQRPEEVPKEILEQGKVFTYSPKSLVLHCFYSANLFSILVILGFTVGMILLCTDRLSFSLGDVIQFAIGGTVAVVLMVLGILYNLVKGFIVYYNFRTYRDGSDIHLRYGLLKLRSYTIPFEKINAVEIVQPAISRLFKKYQVKIKTVGISDEKNEISNLTMSLSKEEMLRQMEILLPEFLMETNLTGIKLEEKKGFKLELVRGIKWVVILSVVTLILMKVTGIANWILVIMLGAILIYVLLLKVLRHQTAGYRIGDEFLSLSSGCFQKVIMICQYRKIQILQWDYHLLARRWGIVVGQVDLLETSATIPYIKEEEKEILTEKIMGRAV